MTVIYLDPMLPLGSSSLPEGHSRDIFTLLFGLAPNGVCPHTCHHACRKLLPPVFTVAIWLFSFCGTFRTQYVCTHQALDVIQHSSRWSPDFPLYLMVQQLLVLLASLVYQLLTKKGIGTVFSDYNVLVFPHV